MQKIALCLLALVLAFCDGGYAAEAYFANHNQVRQIVLEPGGAALWYATGGGLVRYDLVTELYQVVSVTSGLPASDINSLAFTGAGTLIAGSANGGVAWRPAGGRWYGSGEYDGLPGNSVLHVSAIGSTGNSSEDIFWAGTLAGARRMVAAGGYLEPDRNAPVVLPTSAVYDIAQAIDGSTWFAVGAGVWRMGPDGNFTSYGTAEGAGPASVTEVEADPVTSGEVFIALGNRVARFNGSGFSPVAGAVASGTITDLAMVGADENGAALFAATAGTSIYKLTSTLAWELWETATDTLSAAGPIFSTNISGGGEPTLPPNKRPAAGSLHSGLLLPRPIGGYSAVTVPGPLLNLMTRVAVDSRGAVWTGSASDAVQRAGAGVSRFDGSEWTHYTQANSGLLMNMIASVNPAPDGRVYLGTWYGPTVIGSGGFNILDDRGTANPGDDLWETYTANETGLAMGVVRGEMAFDSAGGVWIASGFNQQQPGGLDYFVPSTKEFHSYSNSLASRNVRTVAIDRPGNLWIGYVDNGLAVIPGGFGGEVRNITAFSATVGDGTVVDISADPVDGIWVATRGKLVKINYQGNPANQAGYAYSEIKPEGFAGLAVLDVEFEGENTAWLATADGIYRTDLAGISWQHYDRAGSALGSNKVNDLAVDNARGVLWAATGNGLSALPLAAETSRRTSRHQLTVSPNPWYPERHGLLSVTGVPLYSKVSVLTVSGERVRAWGSARQNGRAFQWDGLTAGGSPCASGVYLILAVAPDGSAYSGKVALIR